MKNTSVSFQYDAEKIAALEMYLANSGMTLEAELKKTVDNLFHKQVPAQVREYIDRRSGEKSMSGKEKPRSPLSQQEAASASRCSTENAP